MKYMINYYDDFKYFNDEQVTDIVLDLIKDFCGELPNFMIKHQDKNICMRIPDIEAAEEFLDILYEPLSAKEGEHNLSIAVGDIGEDIVEFVTKLNEGKIPFYFDEVITNAEVAEKAISLGADKIIIAGNAGFELESLYEKIALSETYTDIVVVPNYIPENDSMLSSIENNINEFYILPQHLSKYEDIIDAIYFYNSKYDRQNTLYEIYEKKKETQVNIQTLIHNLKYPKPIMTNTITDTFVAGRSVCRGLCTSLDCEICKTEFKLAEFLTENNLKIEPENEANQAYNYWKTFKARHMDTQQGMSTESFKDFMKEWKNLSPQQKEKYMADLAKVNEIKNKIREYNDSDIMWAIVACLSLDEDVLTTLALNINTWFELTEEQQIEIKEGILNNLDYSHKAAFLALTLLKAAYKK